jgi:hypothetical protein
LPDIPIPLVSPDPDLTLDFKAVFRAAYEPAIYDRRLRYKEPLAPPFRPADEQWVQQKLAAVQR